MSTEHPPSDHFKISPGLLPVIVALAIQSATAIWWASGVERRIVTLESEVRPLSQLSDTVGRLDERSKATADGIDRVEHKLDDLTAIRAK